MRSVELKARGIAGASIIVSSLLSRYHSDKWLYLSAFFGLTVFQSAFTHFCPLEFVLEKFETKNCIE